MRISPPSISSPISQVEGSWQGYWQEVSELPYPEYILVTTEGIELLQTHGFGRTAVEAQKRGGAEWLWQTRGRYGGVVMVLERSGRQAGRKSRHLDHGTWCAYKLLREQERHENISQHYGGDGNARLLSSHYDSH